MSIGSGITSAVDDIVRAAMVDRKERESYEAAVGRINALSQMGVKGGQIVKIDPNIKDKDIVPFVNKKALDDIRNNKQLNRAQKQGEIKAYTDIGMANLRMQLQQAAQQAANPRMNVQVGGTNYPVSPERALTEAVESPERPLKKQQAEATLAHTGAATDYTKAQTETIKAAAEAPTVAMDIGGGNIARVRVDELIKHPEFLRDQSAKDLNNQIFATTGLGIPQVAQGWNKQIKNGQLTFEAPVVQQAIDPITQKPIPRYNANGTPVYETVNNPAFDPKQSESDKNSKVLTKTMSYAIPQEMTSDVIRLIGTGGVSGADQLPPIPKKEDRDTKIIPGSIGRPVNGERRTINGVQAIWDGQGWLKAP